jgi:hypothetical protein
MPADVGPRPRIIKLHRRCHGVQTSVPYHIQKCDGHTNGCCMQIYFKLPISLLMYWLVYILSHGSDGQRQPTGVSVCHVRTFTRKGTWYERKRRPVWGRSTPSVILRRNDGLLA